MSKGAGVSVSGEKNGMSEAYWIVVRGAGRSFGKVEVESRTKLWSLVVLDVNRFNETFLF